ncbi:glycosyltransferase [Alphaproteobacteria bacterium]|nr:glycosyltransferase [Alphaproteobacteria bacterium]
MKKKALIILPSYSVGGAEKVLLSYFKYFKSSKIKLKILIINSKGTKSNFLNKNKIEFNYKKFIYSLPTVIKLLKKENYNFIISTFPHISALILLTKCIKLHNCKVIVRQPNIIEASLTGTFKLFLLKHIYIKLIKYADAVIVTSNHMLKEAKKNKILEKRIFLVTNPLDLKKTRANIQPYRVKGEKIKLIFVGRLVYQKGIDRILYLFKKITNIELLLIGDGIEKQKLQRKVKELKAEKNIKFLGHKKKPFKYMAGADYFILPSRWEGLPNCVIESLALGTPVIAFSEIKPLLDYKQNIKNKSLILCDNFQSLELVLRSIRRRTDYKKPQLRKSFLVNYITPKNYQNKINNILLKI